MGMGKPQKEDKVYVLRGGKLPFVLRPHENIDGHFSVVGHCYVHGFMDGELLKSPWQNTGMLATRISRTGVLKSISRGRSGVACWTNDTHPAAKLGK
jgi:hypothetical protein